MLGIYTLPLASIDVVSSFLCEVGGDMVLDLDLDSLIMTDVYILLGLTSWIEFRLPTLLANFVFGD